MINENILKTICSSATICRNRHESGRWASSNSGSSVLELSHKLSEQSVWVVRVCWVVVVSSSAHYCFSNNNKEICQRYSCANALVHDVQVKLLHTVFKSEIVWIVEVNATISSSSTWRAKSEVHEIMANKSDNATSVWAPEVWCISYCVGEGLPLLNSGICDSFILICSKSRWCCNRRCTSRTYEVLIGVLDWSVNGSLHDWSRCFWTAAVKAEWTLGSTNWS